MTDPVCWLSQQAADWLSWWFDIGRVIQHLWWLFPPVDR